MPTRLPDFEPRTPALPGITLRNGADSQGILPMREQPFGTISVLPTRRSPTIILCDSNEKVTTHVPDQQQKQQPTSDVQRIWTGATWTEFIHAEQAPKPRFDFPKRNDPFYKHEGD